MRKEIQKDGSTSHKIRINAEDLRLHKLKLGDVVELTITKILDEDEIPESKVRKKKVVKKNDKR